MTVEPVFEIQVHECARLFRLGRDVEAAQRMVEVFDGLATLLAAAPPAVAQQCPAVLNSLLRAQQAQDWLGLADTLDVELMQLLKQSEA
jgi:hypothetical protein